MRKLTFAMNLSLDGYIAATRRHIEAECPQRVPFPTQHSLGAVVNRPSVWSDR